MRINLWILQQRNLNLSLSHSWVNKNTNLNNSTITTVIIKSCLVRFTTILWILSNQIFNLKCNNTHPLIRTSITKTMLLNTNNLSLYLINLQAFQQPRLNSSYLKYHNLHHISPTLSIFKPGKKCYNRAIWDKAASIQVWVIKINLCDYQQY